MDQTKNQKNESLKQEIRRLRQQMTDMHRAWAIGLPSPPFPFIDPTNTSSFPSKSQSQFSTVVDAPQHDSEFIPSQKYLNIFTIFPLAPQHEPSTFTIPHVVCDLVSQSSSGTSTLGCPTVVCPHVASEPIFNTLGDHCYTPEPVFKLTGPPKFLNKKFSVPEESEKMVEKMKSAENAMKNSLGPAGKKDISYKDWGMPSSANPPPIFEMLKFEKQDRRRHRCRQSQAQVHTQALHNHSQNPLYSISPPPYLVYCAQPYAQLSSYLRWCAPNLQSHPSIPQTYQSPSRTDVRSKLNNEMRQKLRDSFTPIEVSYANLFQILAQRGIITLLLGYTPDPYSRSFDPNVRCAYHSDVQGHSIEYCRSLKREIEKMIQDKLIMVQNIDSEENSSHANMQTSD
ncbi:hypothetical protein P3L10_031276 [Capsicum annuum]